MIIVFFVGLIIMVSGGAISDACNVAYINMICNIVGGIMMGSSAHYFTKSEEKRKNELKRMLENLAGKEEHENEMKVLSSIETLLQEYSKIISIIEQDQKRVINIVGDNSVIKESIETINASLDNHFSSLEKEMVNQNDKLAVSRKSQIDELIGHINNLFVNNAKNAEKMLGAIKNVEKILEVEKPLINHAIEELHQDNTELMAKVEDSLSKLIKNTIDVLDKFQLQVNQVEKANTAIVESLQAIDQRIIGINILPQEISESVDTLIEKFGNTIENIQIDYKNLAEDLEDQEKDRTKRFNSIMNEIRDAAEESNEEMVEEIKKLADQYAMFEKMITTIVKQMSHMAEEDIKVMKGFLNG